MLEMKIKCWASPQWATPWYRLKEWARRTWHTFFGHTAIAECMWLDNEWYCDGCMAFLVRRDV